jgi:hypothetical protein
MPYPLTPRFITRTPGSRASSCSLKTSSLGTPTLATKESPITKMRGDARSSGAKSSSRKPSALISMRCAV